MKEKDKGFHCSHPGVTGRAAAFPRGACSLSVCRPWTQPAPPCLPLYWCPLNICTFLAQTIVQKLATPTKFKDGLHIAWKEHRPQTGSMNCPLGSFLVWGISFIQYFPLLSVYVFQPRCRLLFHLCCNTRQFTVSPFEQGWGLPRKSRA